jgi:di/tricarboxylate transporter
VDFRRRYGVLVLGLWRRSITQPEQLGRTRLREGDVLVLQGNEDALARVSADRDFLLLVPFQAETRRRHKALLAAGIMLATIGLASSGWKPLPITMMIGAAAMLLTGCLTIRQAYRAIDAPMYLFVAGAIPLGLAMSKSGTADLLAGLIVGTVGGWREVILLFTLFVIVGVAVQFMGSDSATTALFGPMAIALAQGLGRAPEVYVVTVAVAAVTATLTPMAHHNLVIYRPGGYRFFDYTRVGAPLTLLIGAIVALLAPRLWQP